MLPSLNEVIIIISIELLYTVLTISIKSRTLASALK